MGKYNFEFEKNDYKTPPELYNMALEHFKIKEFDLDTCCTVKNIPAKEHYIDGISDGLKEDWRGFNWCNPPFNECQKWIKKAYTEFIEHGHKTAMLIPVRTETAYWHEYILNNPFMDISKNIVFLRKGYGFINEKNEQMGVFKNALAFVYFE